jgi:NTE family protein
MLFGQHIFKKKKEHQVGLVLSGGGLRGIGHIGALKALEEHGYRPTILSGCSAGAIIGAFYAAGYTPDELRNIAFESSFFPRSSFRLRMSGFIDTGFLSKLFQQYIPANTFEMLKMPLYVAVTDIVAGKTEYLHSGQLDQALLASSSLPLLFPPFKSGEKVYYDGGILDNLPIKPIITQCEFLIGVHVNALAPVSAQALTVRKTMDQIVHLAIGQSVYRNARKCHLFIDPPAMNQFSMFNKRDAQKIYDHVYDHTSRQLDQQKTK